MRKIFVFLFISAFACTAIQAQKKPLGKKHLDWGLRSGINLSTLHIDQPNTTIKWRTGFVAGAFFRIHVASQFSVQPEFLFSSMGAKVDNGISAYTQRINYFSIPILAKYQFAKCFAAVAGPQFDFLLQARQLNDMESTSATNNYKDHSYNLTGGFEFWPSACVGASARYMHGLNSITNSGPSVKNQGVQITIAVKL